MTSLAPPDSWSLILDTALDAVVVMDNIGNVVDWNASATAIFGWTRDEVVGRLMADFIVPHDLRAAHADGLARYLSTGERHVLGQRIEISALRRTGEEFPVELSISPLKVQNGQLFLGFLRDISERRSAERLRELHTRKTEALYETIAFAAELDSIDSALKACLVSVQKLTEWPIGHVYLPSGEAPERLIPSPIWLNTRPQAFEKFQAATAASDFASGEGLPGRVWASREPQWISDIRDDPDFLRNRAPGGLEIRAAIGFPIVTRNEIIAVIEFFSDEVIEPDPDLLKALRAIGEQVGRVFERRRAEEDLKRHALSLELEVAERKKAEAQQRLLVAEVSHRVKNTLAVVSGIAQQTGKHSATIAEFRTSFSQRLNALSVAHSLITSRNWAATSLQDLAEQVLTPFRTDAERLEIGGPELLIPPKAVLAVAMVLHELVTNALKYGGLATPGGRVVLEWSVEGEPASLVTLRWIESGVGPVSPPARSGFGSKMIAASVKHDLQGSVEMIYGNDGIECRLELPLSTLQM